MENINKEINKTIKALEKVLDQEKTIREIVNCMSNTIQSGGRVFFSSIGTPSRMVDIFFEEWIDWYGFHKNDFIRVLNNLENNMFSVKDKKYMESQGSFSIIKLLDHELNNNDILIAISSTGETEFVNFSVNYANEIGVKTISITFNKESRLYKNCDFSVHIDISDSLSQNSTILTILNTIVISTATNLGHIYNDKFLFVKPIKGQLLNYCIKTVEYFTNKELSEEDVNDIKKFGILPCIISKISNKNLTESKQISENTTKRLRWLKENIKKLN